MFFVDRPVHSHGGLQTVQPTVDTDTVGEGCQGGGAEAGGARGDGVTDETHHAGVDLIPRQTQLSQDLLSVFQTAVRPEPQTHTGNTGNTEDQTK